MAYSEILFMFVAGVTVISALGVVVSKEIVRSAAYLILALVGVAAAFSLMDSLFMAMIQLLIYAGAVMVLFLFGVMLTRKEAPAKRRRLLSRTNLSYLILSVVLFFLVARSGLMDTSVLGGIPGPVSAIAPSLYTEFKGVLYALAGLLVTVGLGAIYIVKKEANEGKNA